MVQEIRISSSIVISYLSQKNSKLIVNGINIYFLW